MASIAAIMAAFASTANREVQEAAGSVLDRSLLLLRAQLSLELFDSSLSLRLLVLRRRRRGA
jgi:hypothetical protein